MYQGCLHTIVKSVKEIGDKASQCNPDMLHSS